MIVLTPQPEHHTSPWWVIPCARCEWSRLHYNLTHWVRIRQEYKI